MTSIEAFENYHPLFVEGMGGYDTRDPEQVADVVAASVIAHWKEHPPAKQPLLIIQGDPLDEGISVSRLLCQYPALQRFDRLDEDLAVTIRQMLTR